MLSVEDHPPGDYNLTIEVSDIFGQNADITLSFFLPGKLVQLDLMNYNIFLISLSLSLSLFLSLSLHSLIHSLTYLHRAPATWAVLP